MTKPRIKTTLADLAASYLPNGRSGRVACPLTTQFGPCTHIYRSFGKIRLEFIDGAPKSGRGFQGLDVLSAEEYWDSMCSWLRRKFWIED